MNAVSVIETRQAAMARRHCRRVTRRRARNFYYGLKLLPEPKRSALYAVYAWMRRADDLIDGANHDHPSVIQSHLADYREATLRAIAGKPVDHDPLWIALAETANRFGLSLEHFQAVLDGQLDDLNGAAYETFEQVKAYCVRVASSVGLLCLEIWGYRDPAARRLAVDRGIGFQLTNILRDYKQDCDAGRIYLPLQDFEEHDITPQILRGWSRPVACHRMIDDQIARAESYYDRSAALDALVTPDCRPTLWAMTSIYRGLLDKMKRRPSRLTQGRRIRLSALHKASIAVQARWRGQILRLGKQADAAALSGNAPR